MCAKEQSAPTACAKHEATKIECHRCGFDNPTIGWALKTLVPSHTQSRTVPWSSCVADSRSMPRSSLCSIVGRADGRMGRRGGRVGLSHSWLDRRRAGLRTSLQRALVTTGVRAWPRDGSTKLGCNLAHGSARKVRDQVQFMPATKSDQSEGCSSHKAGLVIDTRTEAALLPSEDDRAFGMRLPLRCRVLPRR
jgi:hypothetical protein